MAKTAIRWYNEEIKDIYGDDLDAILGPRAGRRPLTQATDTEVKNIRKCIKKVTDGVIATHDRGLVKFTDAVRLVLDHLKRSIDPATQKPALWGWELPLIDLKKAVKGLESHSQEDIMLNYRAQRNINVVHLFNLPVDFDSSLVFGAKGRRMANGEIFINDGQHGSILLALVGVETIPAQYIESDQEYHDFNQFIACNLQAMPADDYDNHRNQLNRAIRMLSETGGIKHEDQSHYDLHQVLSRERVTLIPPRGKTPGDGESKHTSKFINYFDEFDQEIFKRSIRIIRNAWPTKSVPHEPLWGLCKLLSSQHETDKTKIRKMDQAIALALGERWEKPEQIWPEVNSAIKGQYPLTKYRDAAETNTGNRGYMIGAAIASTVENYDLYITSQAGSPRGLGVSIAPCSRIDDSFEFYVSMPFMSADGSVYDVNDIEETEEDTV
jgi:hypothetical protein